MNADLSMSRPVMPGGGFDDFPGIGNDGQSLHVGRRDLHSYPAHEYTVKGHMRHAVAKHRSFVAGNRREHCDCIPGMNLLAGIHGSAVPVFESRTCMSCYNVTIQNNT